MFEIKVFVMFEIKKISYSIKIKLKVNQRVYLILLGCYLYQYNIKFISSDTKHSMTF